MFIIFLTFRSLLVLVRLTYVIRVLEENRSSSLEQVEHAGEDAALSLRPGRDRLFETTEDSGFIGIFLDGVTNRRNKDHYEGRERTSSKPRRWPRRRT